MTAFVVVHGAWSGAWAWSRVAARLRAKGHDVHIPTLSGLGERTHLAHLPITLGTHIDDVANEILFHDLTGVVLVMHSYGSFVGAAVAERLADRISALVFVDAFVPKDGERLVDMLPGFEVGAQVTPPPEGGPEDYLNEADWRWASSKATPHPSATLTEGVRLTGAYLDSPNKTYVLATGWDGFQSIAATRSYRLERGRTQMWTRRCNRHAGRTRGSIDSGGRPQKPPLVSAGRSKNGRAKPCPGSGMDAENRAMSEQPPGSPFSEPGPSLIT